jgi:hypothetical protein
VTAGFGVNAAHGVVRHAVFGEYTRQLASTALSGSRRTGGNGSVDRKRRLADGRRDARVFNGLRLEALVGANVTVYAVPEAVKPAYGEAGVVSAVPAHQAAAGHMGRMWNMRMAKPF